MLEIRRIAAAVTMACLALALAPAGRGADEDVGRTLLREPWRRGQERYQRHWQLLGPIPGSDAFTSDGLGSEGGEAAARPKAGASHALTNGTSLTWADYPSYLDALDLNAALGRSRNSIISYIRKDSAPEVAYAYALVRGEQDGPALLSLGNDGAVRVWLNGALIHERGPRSFAADEDQIPVQLFKGENRLLIKLEHRTGPWRLAVRVLPPAALTERTQELAPAVLPDSSGALSVRTHVRAEPDKAPVHVEVLAAGGRVVAARDEARGSVARFETGAWPDGAYEIRCTTRSAWDTPWFTHIAWYKGDPLAAARRLMAAARTAAADPTGATLRMLSEMVLDRLGGSLEATPDDAWMSLHAPLLEFEELELERAGTASRLRPSGFVRFAYLDDVDGAPQFCRTYLPPDYDPRRPSPLIVYLHGFNPFNPPYLGWWLVDQRHDTTADRHGVIFMEPHGRGNTSYEGIGDRDVLRCIDEARRQLAVDPDRVYLFGESMGGHGVWRVATRHPDLFAAIAPVFGGWDQRLLAKDGGRTPGATDWDRFLQEQDASFSGAESLLNVPVFIHHGDQDQGVSPEHSRFAARMLQRWGYDVRYHEHPGLGHEWLGVRDEIARWLLEHRRDPAPRHVRLRAATLGTAAAHWVRVEARESSSEFTLVDAAIAEPGVVRLDTRNAARIALAPPASLRGAGETLHVVWNGQALDVPLRDGRAVVGRDAGQGLVKRAGVEGPLPDVFTTPFAIVVGTASLDPLMRQRCQEKADAVAGSWRSWQHATPRLIKDSALTPADEQRYSLLLVGGADANSVTRRIAPRLPLKVEPAAITIDGRRFPATDAVVQMIYPSPFSTERYVVVVAATSADGLYFWTPPTPPGPSRWDFTLEDGRRVMLPEGTPADRGFVAAGVFDQRWRREDGLITTGDTALRSKSALRHAPRPGFVVAERVLDSYAGRYQFPWGLTVTLTRKARQLSVEGPGIPVGTLTAATETEFVLDTPAAELTFTRDAQGAVNGFLFYQGGRELSAQRLR